MQLPRKDAVRTPGSSLARRRGGPWLVTLLATAVSTYALDAIAAAVGVALATSGLLAGSDHPYVLLFLACSYVVWGLGLRANLTANWALLARSGTSTNVLSKAAHDLASGRTRSVRTRRIAASAGYLVTELAKEAPYYAGASGALLLSDGVTADDAIVFLAGANLGAAAYEYALARATGIFLRSRPAGDGDAP
jgi:hypothetical protein